MKQSWDLIVLTIGVLQHILSLKVMLAAGSHLPRGILCCTSRTTEEPAVPWHCTSVISKEPGGAQCSPEELTLPSAVSYPCRHLSTSHTPSPAVTAAFFCQWNEPSGFQIWRNWVSGPYLWLLPDVSFEPFPAQP